MIYRHPFTSLHSRQKKDFERDPFYLARLFHSLSLSVTTPLGTYGGAMFQLLKRRDPRSRAIHKYILRIYSFPEPRAIRDRPLTQAFAAFARALRPVSSIYSLRALPCSPVLPRCSPVLPRYSLVLPLSHFLLARYSF